MNGLIVSITLLFLATGLAYGIGARTIKSIDDVIRRHGEGRRRAWRA